MATWYAGTHSTDSGNNTGWIFTAPPSGGTISVVLDDISADFTGSLTHNGTFSALLDDVSVALDGQIVHNASIAVVLDDIAADLTGEVISNGSISVVFDDVSADFVGEVTPGPTPVSVITKGGITKRTKNYKNQREDVERDIARAINKVLGTDEGPERVIIEPEKARPKRDYTQQIRELALESQINALGQTISDYESALAQAELDDEEAILLLL